MYILPEHIWGKLAKSEITKYKARGRRRLGPVHAREVREGPVRALQGEPELLARQAEGRPRRAPQLQQPGRDGRGAQARRDRRRRGRAGRAVPRSSRRTRAIETVEGYQGAMNELAINGGAGLKKPHPALLDKRVRAGDRPRDRSRRRSSTACWPGSASRPRRSACPPTRRGRPADPAPSSSSHFDLDQAQARSSTTPATRTPTATASARCPAAGSR